VGGGPAPARLTLATAAATPGMMPAEKAPMAALDSSSGGSEDAAAAAAAVAAVAVAVAGASAVEGPAAAAAAAAGGAHSAVAASARDHSASPASSTLPAPRGRTLDAINVVDSECKRISAQAAASSTLQQSRA
jgi:hypothetical protein